MYHPKRLSCRLFLFSAGVYFTLTSCTKSNNALPIPIEVPDGFVVEVAAGPDLVDYPMFAVADETGRLFVFESTGNVYNKTEDAIKNPQFRINLLEDLDGDGTYEGTDAVRHGLGAGPVLDGRVV